MYQINSATDKQSRKKHSNLPYIETIFLCSPIADTHSMNQTTHTIFRCSKCNPSARSNNNLPVAHFHELRTNLQPALFIGGQMGPDLLSYSEWYGSFSSNREKERERVRRSTRPTSLGEAHDSAHVDCPRYCIFRSSAAG